MFIYIDKLYIEIKVISDICLIGFVDDFYFKELILRIYLEIYL